MYINVFLIVLHTLIIKITIRNPKMTTLLAFASLKRLSGHDVFGGRV